jgi:uncharacterized protein
VKRVVRAVWTVEHGWRRSLARRLGRRRFELAGNCESCAKCCDAPSIRVGLLTWHLPRVRRMFLAWQSRINGFTFVREERDLQVFVFDCTHFDKATRRCDSYETRPFMCRDYPRLLLEDPWPELFPECGYRPVDTKGAALRDAIDGTDLSEEKKAELRRRLRVL